MAAMPRVAYATMMPSFPPRFGGAIRSFEIVRSLRELGFDAVLISPRVPDSNQEPPEWVRLFSDRVTAPARVRRKAGAFRAGLPWNWSPLLSRVLTLDLARAESEGRKIIVAGSSGIANLPTPAWHRAIVDSHNLELIRLQRTTGSGVVPRINLERALGFEVKALQRSYAFLVCSDLEERVAVSTVPDANVHVLPNGVVRKSTVFPIPKRPRAYFVGKLDYQPNYEGLQWLAEQVWPTVLESLPDAELHVVGSGVLPPSVAIALRSSAGITVVGEVDSIDDIQRESRVALIPILTGGGTRLKLLEACAGSRAIVTTPVGAEGIELPGFVSRSSTPAAFAFETIRRLIDDELVTREGRALAQWVDGMRWETLVEQTLVPLLLASPLR